MFTERHYNRNTKNVKNFFKIISLFFDAKICENNRNILKMSAAYGRMSVAYGHIGGFVRCYLEKKGDNNGKTIQFCVDNTAL